MTRFTTVLFDLDGTLIDSIRLILDSYHHTLQAHGFPARTDEQWLAGVGTPLRTQFADWSHDADLLESMVATYREFNLANHDRMVTVYPGIGDMLRRLRDAGLKLALVTSKNRQGALRGLRLTGLAEYFEVLVCVDDVTNPKPHPEPVERALALLGADRKDAVFIGDSVHDMHSGRAAGVSTAAALWGPFGRAHLEGTEPDFWLGTPHDVLVMLGLVEAEQAGRERVGG